jgi:glucosylceramidase
MKNEKKGVLLGIFAFLSLALLPACSSHAAVSSQGASNSVSSGVPAKVGTYAAVYETTGTKSHILSRLDDTPWVDYSFTGNNEIHLDSSKKVGELTGYGAALTHSSAYLLETLSAENKALALDWLFGEDGARLNCIRIPIGTSDYTNTTSFYTLDDTDGSKDYNLAKFSLAKDQEYLIPALQDILKVNPNICFFAAPWSAPAWMKANNSLLGGSLVEGDSESGKASNEEIAFASYLTKFVSSYHDLGINIRYLSLENEPSMGSVTYPTMNMSANQWARLCRLTGRQLKAAGLTDTKIIAYDHNVGDSSGDILYSQFADEVSADAEVSSYVAGFALHCYSNGWQSNHTSFLQEQTAAFPDKDFFITEITESEGGGVDFALNLSWAMQNVTVGPEAAGASASLYWNFLLTDQGKPVLGNSSICYGVLTLKDGVLYRNPAYYAMAHIAKFAYPQENVLPVRLDSYADNESKINSVTYERKDGTLVTTIVNVDATTYEDVALVKDGNKMIPLRVYPQSAVTLVSEAEEETPYEAIDFSDLRLAMESKDTYQFSFAAPKASAATSFYFVREQAAYAEADKIDFSSSSGRFSCTLNRDPGDYTLYAVESDKKGAFNISLPKMAPTVASQSNGSVLISFEFDPATSWSSYCDPYGKNIYRSAQSTYDSSAEKVNVTTDLKDDPIYITSTTYTDNHADAAKPFYFLVLSAKGGKETIVSYPLVSEEHLFGAKTASLVLEGEKPLLKANLTLMSGVSASQFALLVKDVNGESHQAPNQGTETGTASFAFDLSSLEKSGVWYDIQAFYLPSGTGYDFRKTDAVDFSASITAGSYTYTFQEWEGILKVNRS